MRTPLFCLSFHILSDFSRCTNDGASGGGMSIRFLKFILDARHRRIAPLAAISIRSNPTLLVSAMVVVDAQAKFHRQPQRVAIVF